MVKYLSYEYRELGVAKWQDAYFGVIYKWICKLFYQKKLIKYPYTFIIVEIHHVSCCEHNTPNDYLTGDCSRPTIGGWIHPFPTKLEFIM